MVTLCMSTRLKSLEILILNSSDVLRSQSFREKITSFSCIQTSTEAYTFTFIAFSSLSGKLKSPRRQIAIITFNRSAILKFSNQSVASCRTCMISLSKIRSIFKARSTRVNKSLQTISAWNSCLT